MAVVLTAPDRSTVEEADPGAVSAILVTRGDVDLTRILETLEEFDEVLVWDNGAGKLYAIRNGIIEIRAAPVVDLAVYGRYSAIHSARNDLIYVQDDDCLINAAGVVATAAQWDTRTMIVANMPESRWADYPDSCLVGWGAVFHRDLPRLAWGRFAESQGDAFWEALTREPGQFHRECDVVFTTLTPSVKIDAGFEHLPWAEDPVRAMFKQPGRDLERARMYGLARAARDA